MQRVLPISVRNALGEIMLTRSSMGLPAFTAREIELERLDLERRRDEQKSLITCSGPSAAKQHRVQIHRLEPTYTADTSNELDSSAHKVEVEDDGTYHLIKEIKQVQNRFAKDG
jgi:hypothetical protein